MDKQVMRAQFEAWFLREAKWYGNKDCLEFDGDEYTDGNVQLAFDSWQASREAVEVELPKKYDLGGMASDYRNQGIDECIAAIKDCGLKVKP